MMAMRRSVKTSGPWIVGIDEVGRGALAGPVMVAAVMLRLDARGRVVHAPFRSLKDSKKLSAAQREFWAKALRGNPTVARFATARVYPRGIERMNISAAANRAALAAFRQLLKKCEISQARKVQIFLDGGLYLGSKKYQEDAVKARNINAKTVIKADEKIAAVAAASIIAKVSRDAYMRRLAKQYPAYGFGIHKGYGTAEHLRAIKKYGPCASHRLTFLKKPTKIER